MRLAGTLTTFHISLFFMIVSAYAALTDLPSWVVWVALGVVFFERIALQATIWYAGKVMKSKAKEAIQLMAYQMEAMTKAAGPSLFDAEKLDNPDDQEHNS